MAADPLANSGSFFGMTTLGATDPFYDNAATTLHYPFHEIPLEAYMDVFDAFKLGHSEIASTLKVDGETHVLRSKLGNMLNALLGRQARKTELQAFFTFFDYDRGCLMSLHEYELAVTMLREFSAEPQQARQYSSYEVWRADWLRNRRVKWEVTHAFQQPLTTAQQIGWHCIKPHIPAGEKHISLTHTDVTKGEGRCAASYYGAALG